MRPQLTVVPLAIVFVLLGTVVGMLRLMYLNGITAQPIASALYGHHGEIMVFGFLATLIVTERYLGSLDLPLPRPVHAMPFMVGLGALTKLIGWLAGVESLDVLGTLLLGLGVIGYLVLLYHLASGRDPAAYRFLGLAAVLLLTAALLTLRYRPSGNLGLTLVLLGFPVMTILGERLELSRVVAPRSPARSGWMLSLAAAAWVLLLAYVVGPRKGYLIVAAVVLLAPVAASLAWGDRRLMATSTQRLGNYVARHLPLAYAWLFLGLLLSAVFALRTGFSQPLFDAASHSLAVGFVGTMILAHGPVIAPAILRRRLNASRLSYIPLGLLTLGNVLRVGGYLLRESGTYVAWPIGMSGAVLLAALLAAALMLVAALR